MKHVLILGLKGVNWEGEVFDVRLQSSREQYMWILIQTKCVSMYPTLD